MLMIRPTKQYRKDLKLAKKRGLDLKKLDEVTEKIAKNQKLEDKHKDHQLSGNYVGIRECHIEPDWLLFYTYDSQNLYLFLLRTGTHSDLF
jgi:mRNA interferase YafQ